MKGIYVILISLLAASLGQLLLKYEMKILGEINLTSIANIIPLALRFSTRPLIITGLLLYVIAAFFWLVALSKVDLSYAYPMASLSYILIFLFSWLIFREHIAGTRVLGMLIIIFGIWLISRS